MPEFTIDTVTQKRDLLVAEFNQMQDKKRELERQLASLDENLHTLRGAVLVCNDFIEQESSNTNEESADVG